MKVANVAMVVGACLAFAALPFQASAQDVEDEEDDDDSHPLTNMPLSANFVNVAYRFEKEPAEGLTMGDRVGVVVGVINTHATKEINVTSAMGSLNSPSDFSQHVYNFSQQLFGANQVPVTIPPGQECSFTYNFYTPNVLQVDFPYQMAVTLFYEDDYELFSDTFFNGTALFAEPDLEWNSKSIVETGLLFGVAAGLYVYFQKAWSPQGTATGTVDFSTIEKVDNSWDAVQERGPAKRVH